MSKLAFVFFSVVLGLCQLAAAEQAADSSRKGSTEAVPSVISAGMDAYKEKGPDEAVKAWIKGSPIDGSKDALSHANLLRQIQDYYGAYRAFEVVSTHDISSTTRIVYLVLDFEKGPLFAKFLVYRTDQGWILTSFNFNTKDTAILP